MSNTKQPATKQPTTKQPSTTPKTWTLPIPNFKATDINYTVHKNDSCVVCQNYDEIDNFARAVTLEKLRPLYQRSEDIASSSTMGSHKENEFDATLLLQSMDTIRNVERSKDAVKEKEWETVLAILRKNNLYHDNTKDSLQAIFSLYANYSVKSGPDQAKNDEKYLMAVTALHQRLATAPADQRPAIEQELKDVNDKKSEGDVLGKFILETINVQMVGKVAQALWQGFTKAKINAHPKTYNVEPHPQDDYVARARLFHTWLSLSVTYDRELAYNLALREKLASDRPIADILSTGTEVCKGYADMFAAMFNGCHPEAVDKATSFTGYTRQKGGPQLNEWASSETKKTCHQWVAFPCPGLNPPIKVIDPTWARYQGPNLHTDDPWFCATNAAMSMSHYPFEAGNLHLPLAGPPLDPKAMWKKSQPYFDPKGKSFMFLIDFSTITPMSGWIATSPPPAAGTAPKSKTLVVKFRNNCKHQEAKTNGFYLGFKASPIEHDGPIVPKTAENFLITPFSCDETVAFTKDPDRPHPDEPCLWTATLNIDPKHIGWIFIYHTDNKAQPRETGQRIAVFIC